MIPISLTIEGLYSYRKKQQIDFETLTSNQLFGIFGAVGSGKSSILEAIIFAVYGESDRLNKSGDNRYYNMMNLQSDKILIDFSCFAGNRGEERFRFIFEAKRNPKKFEEVKTSGRRVLKEINGEWQALENYDITEIIGMNAKNFRQTVIIPQGKFREFIEMGGKDRTAMLQELFQLDKFDLSDRTRQLSFQNKDEVLTLETRLEGLQEFTAEKLKENEESTALLTEDIEKRKRLFERRKKEHADQLVLKELFEEKTKIENWLAEQEDRKKDADNREAYLERYDLADRLFREKLLQEGRAIKDIDIKDTQIQSSAGKVHRLETVCQQATEHYDKQKKEYGKRDKRKDQLNDIETIISIKSTEYDLQNLIKAFDLKKRETEELGKAFKESEEKEKNITVALQETKNKLEDINLLKDAESLLARKSELDKQQRNLKASLNTLQAQGEELISQKKEQLQKLNIEEDSLEKAVSIKVLLEEQEADVAVELISLEARKKYLADLKNLEEGKPCPLCGATHHPAKHEKDISSDAESELEQELSTIKEKQKILQSAKDKLVSIAAESKTNISLKTEKEKSLEEVATTLKEVKASIVAKNISFESIEEVQKALAVHQKLSEEIKRLEAILDKERGNIKQLQLKGDEAKLHFQKLETDKITAERSIEKDLKSLKELKYEGKFKDLSIEELEARRENGIQYLESLESNYREAEEQLKALELERKGAESTLLSEQKFLSELRKNLDEIRVVIYSEIDNSPHFNDLQEVKGLLRENIDLQTEKKNIESFRKAVQEAEIKLADLQSKITDKPFDTATFKELEEALEILEAEILQKQNQLAVLKDDAVRIKEKIELRKAQEADLHKAQLRGDNLKVLASLFKARGFVEFVSSIYLKNLVEVANNRFMRLTKNNLSLELNESNDFIVRDYLNNGKTRLLKTLSGGQTFQAALCLALALAEHVKSLNTSDRSFFFLDEGFGTLDKSSLQVVFETLRSLQKENRIVGVISHVEELQQEIDVSLMVKNDRDEGSLVSYSWDN
ncbi:MAG: hypothetical protein CMO01_11985 [Thalassobius sp.]|nr:hypothetical protein [Thalassovita sp.]